jgi:hypothetical protein
MYDLERSKTRKEKREDTRSMLKSYKGRLLREILYAGNTPSEQRRVKRLRRLRLIAMYGVPYRPENVIYHAETGQVTIGGLNLHAYDLTISEMQP